MFGLIELCYIYVRMFPINLHLYTHHVMSQGEVVTSDDVTGSLPSNQRKIYPRFQLTVVADNCKSDEV
jgi:hypothetical protein